MRVATRIPTALRNASERGERYARLAGERLRRELLRARFRLDPDARPLRGTEALGDLPPDATLLFLCLGNICRSPMAERYARARLAEAGRADVSVESAGFVREEGRPSPEPAVEAARSYGVDLSDHASRRVTAAQLRRSDVVFLMDVKNYRRLERDFESAADKAYFLAPAVVDAFEIEDPYPSTDVERYRTAYEIVTEAVDEVIDALPTREPSPVEDQSA
ncbi:arsenate reductase/protein-tyrosine-phosphatase family protein [Halegenticoccus soli]|uniref:arsenate reductase/protein-tyrosine-phosphatase family protein n=1 Tax=Halegenticoccus soli TaxID=1985678 RepID=UPI0018EA8D12|nr:low molecular weight phosphotyrosine protein phosphatase [Halegenticoccus soli]